jgi:hypothetical protein
MTKIDMQRIRETLPKHGTATLHKKLIQGKTVCYIECWIKHPSLSEMYPYTYEKDFEMIKDWQRQIVGEALSEFYTEQTGHEWKIYLKRVPIEFTNTTDEDIKNYAEIK